jgi:hypothetical protein
MTTVTVSRQPEAAVPGSTLAAAPLAGSPALQTGVNPAAIVSPVLAIASLATFGLAAFPAIIVGHIALRQIRRTGQGGRPAAVAGLVLAYPIALIVLYVFAVLVMWGLGGGDA